MIYKSPLRHTSCLKTPAFCWWPNCCVNVSRFFASYYFRVFSWRDSDCCDRRFNECTDSPNWALSGGLQAGALLNHRNINDRSSAFYRAASQTSLPPIGIEVAISELSNGVLGRQTLGCWLVCLSDSQSVCLFATFGRKSVSYPRVGSPNAPFSCWFINVINVSESIRHQQIRFWLFDDYLIK